MLRQAAIKQLETMFGRSLSDEEKRCVIVKLKDGKLDSRIVSPLSETLKEWHRREWDKRDESNFKKSSRGDSSNG
jgi:hypothetical protein